ncbi:LuxR C-terminal-related transcriptional regulator [Halomonas sp. AOP13-D3-9]
MKRTEDTIRILLADEHRLVRSAISSLIETFDNMTVVAEVGYEQQLIKEAADYDVEVALIDAAVFYLKGLETLSRLRDLCPGIRVVVLSTYSSDSFIRRLFEEGAYGFLHKNADVNELEMAIRKAVLGERFVFTAMEPAKFVDAASVVGAAAFQGNPLTSRQNEVLKLVASGFRSKAIADQLNVSIKTVETHRADIMRRLGVRHTAGLVHEAIRLGLLETPQDTDGPG